MSLNWKPKKHFGKASDHVDGSRATNLRNRKFKSGFAKEFFTIKSMIRHHSFGEKRSKTLNG